MLRALAGLVVAAGLVLGGCGGDDDGGGAAATLPTAPAQVVDAPVPVALPPAERERFARGRDVASRAGCPACHRIGASGSDSPGSNLTGIGDRRPASQIRRALLDPEPPMPSSRALPREDLDALVAFLAALRASDCPQGSDCG